MEKDQEVPKTWRRSHFHQRRKIDRQKSCRKYFTDKTFDSFIQTCEFYRKFEATIWKELLSKKFVENNVGKNLSMDPSRTFCQFVVSIESCRMDRTLVDIFYLKCRQIWDIRFCGTKRKLSTKQKMITVRIIYSVLQIT